MTTENYIIERKTNKHRIAGILGSGLFHGLIIAFLLLYFIYPPNPPLESQGMMMSLGEENMGGPDPAPVENPQPNETYTPISEQADQPEDLASDDPESIAVPEKIKEKKDKVDKKDPKPVDQPKQQLELPKKVNQSLLFKKSNKSGQQGGGYGDGDIPGNEGRPDGDINGDPDGEGKGTSGKGRGGDGIDYQLSGRSMKKMPSIEDNSRSVGKVVVRIVVDRDGNVIKAVPGQDGSTTIESSLLEKARQGALQTKFSPKPDGPEEQYGYMTFVFRFKN